MIENIDELIDKNLKIIFDTDKKSVMRTEFVELNDRKLYESQRLAEIMDEKNLIKLEYSKKYRCDLTEFGLEVSQNGGWLEYLKNKAKTDKKLKEEIKKRDELEYELAKSNIEANKLNQKIAKQNAKNEKSNKIATWVNVAIGIINIGLLVWQIVKAK